MKSDDFISIRFFCLLSDTDKNHGKTKCFRFVLDQCLEIIVMIRKKQKRYRLSEAIYSLQMSNIL